MFKTQKKQFTILAVCMAVFLLGMLFPIGVQADDKISEAEAARQEKMTQTYTEGNKTETLTLSTYDDKSYHVQKYSEGGFGNRGSVTYSYDKSYSGSVTMKAKSSDTAVLTINADSKSRIFSYSGCVNSVGYTVHGVGVATVTVTIGNVSCEMKVCVLPYSMMEIQSITQTSPHEITLQWDNNPKCDGYMIRRALVDEDETTIIAQIDGGSTSSAVVEAPWNQAYKYMVLPYVLLDGEVIAGTDGYYSSESYFTAQAMGAELKSVKQKGSNSFKITWNPIKGATAYKLYASNEQNGKYTCIFTDKKGTGSYTHKVQKGETYYYYLVTYFDKEKSNPSISMSGFIPQKGKASGRTQNKLNQLPDYGGKGQYREYGANWNWVSPDTTYYYEAGGKFHVVSVRDKNLNIYTLNSDMKFAKKKIVKLGDFDVFGGFYHGRDDCFYVAVGYHNPKESSTKTVVKVKKYNSKWKLQKTCNITGGASNSFVGIYEPFEAGACRMDMQGKTLYLFMGRKMFVHSDGLRHQSNISFEINTASMKAKEANDSYCSHSFNQYVRFQDGNLYLIDHGDAYPRSILLTMVTQYGSNHEKKTRTEVFKLQGATGANFTGATVGGMEAGNKNILVCGTAQPHGYAVKGIKGYDNGLKYNAFVAVVNKTTGKSSIKWLTNYHPKKSKVIVGETRMVKLSDDRFAVLFTTTTDHKATLNYVVVNNAGKKVYSKKYSNMVFAGDSQPILYHGYLQWVSTQSTYATGNYYGYTYTYRTGQITKSYRIPATF